MQVDTLLSEAELSVEIASVKRQLTTRQLESLTVNADSVHGMVVVGLLSYGRNKLNHYHVNCPKYLIFLVIV